MYKKPGMLGNIRQEVLDLVVYEDTLREQLVSLLEQMKRVLNFVPDAQLRPRLRELIYGLSDIVNGEPD